MFLNSNSGGGGGRQGSLNILDRLRTHGAGDRNMMLPHIPNQARGVDFLDILDRLTTHGVGDLDMMSKHVPNQAGRGAPKKIYG